MGQVTRGRILSRAGLEGELLGNKINIEASGEGTLGTIVAYDLLHFVGTRSRNIDPNIWARAVALSI